MRAQLISDSTVSPRPSIPEPGGAGAQAAVVQFVVDSLGVPDPARYTALVTRDPALEAAGQGDWESLLWRPALPGRHACIVSQQER